MWKTTSQSSLILSCIASEEIARYVKKKIMKNIWNINKVKKNLLITSQKINTIIKT